MEKGSSIELRAWDWYLEVETRFSEYCEYVPLRKEHFRVWSLKLASLTIEICSILDSFFKAGIPQLFTYFPDFNTDEFLKERKELENDKPNMWTWRRFYNTYYNLSKKEIHVIPLKKSISPFRKWEINKNPKWWDDYNDIKHDKFTKLEKATLKSTLCALGGLFLAVIIHLPNKRYLYDIGVIERIGLSSKFNYHCADMLLRKEPVIVKSGDYIVAKTSLFSYEYQKKELKCVLSTASKKGGIPAWPSDKLWPDCKEDCHYVDCYRTLLSKRKKIR